MYRDFQTYANFAKHFLFVARYTQPPENHPPSIPNRLTITTKKRAGFHLLRDPSGTFLFTRSACVYEGSLFLIAKLYRAND
jgi:hypothetical protein